jgi:DNA polymerase-3 subunit alpha
MEFIKTKIKSIKSVGIHQTYDVEMSAEHSYIANGFVVHNSVGDGFGKIADVCATLANKGFKACAITDHGSLAGALEFQKMMVQKGLKPIAGYEAYITYSSGVENHSSPENHNYSEPAPLSDNYHTTILVKNEQGWQNLLLLHEYATRQNFHYKPRIPLDMLLKHSEGLIVTTGCVSALIPRKLAQGFDMEAEEVLLKLLGAFKDDLYVEIQAHTCVNNLETMKKVFTLAHQYKIKCVFTTDAHYPTKQDKPSHEAIKAIGKKVFYGEAGYKDDCFYLMTIKDIEERLQTHAQWMLPYYQEWLDNTEEVSQKCNFLIKPTELHNMLPQLEGSADLLKQKVLAGLKNTPYTYEGKIKERIDLELNRITNKHFDNYFLMVDDFIQWAKSNGIRIGAGRGSGGASLCLFALGVTQCDPIKYNLLFDRFISEDRKDLPDCDIDFMDTRRDEVFTYLMQKYGVNNCAKIATYSRFHAKGILRDIGRIFNIPIKEVEKICSLVVGEHNTQLSETFTLKETEEFAQKYPMAVELACKLVGHVRNKGQHAAGIVVCKQPIGTYAPIAKVGDEIVTEWEKQTIEDMRLVKFDILGLKTMTVIDDCVKSSGCTLPMEFDDPKVFEQFKTQEGMSGCFQFDQSQMQRFAIQLGINTFEDLYDTTTLFRPATMQNGQSAVYINRKNKAEQYESQYPEAYNKITKPTKGVMLYQEQVMQILHEIGGFTWAQAEVARKLISKSKGVEAIDKMRAEFVQNAQNKMKKEEAEKMFDNIVTFGNYSFNLAHAVGYSIISYWCMFLKTYYPKHFYKSLLKHTTNMTEVQVYLQNAQKQNILIEYPDINKSMLSYEIIDDKIYAGLNSVIGIGEEVAKKIIELRPFTSVNDFKAKTGIGDRIFKGLVIADAFRQWQVNKKAATQPNTLSFFEHCQDYTDAEWAQSILTYTTLKPKIDITKTFDFGTYDFTNIKDITTEFADKNVFVRGIITGIRNKDKYLGEKLKTHTYQYEKHFYELTLNDGTGIIVLQVPPATYELCSGLLTNIEDKPVVVFGNVNGKGQKINVDLLQIVGQGEGMVDKVFNTDKIVLASAQPFVSSNKKSYYRVTLNNGMKGLCFNFTDKLKAGMEVEYDNKTPPFITIKTKKVLPVLEVKNGLNV